MCLCLLSACAFGNGCTTAEPKTFAPEEKPLIKEKKADNEPSGATIAIDEGGPADTVRAFYKKLRERKFREAIFLTNLRPAIESLTDAELKDFALDFENIAGQVPAEVEINGEIVSGDAATVTANFPGDDPDKKEIQQIKLRRDNGVWIIQTVDEATEKRIKAEGKQYFYNLRIETHQQEARDMLERISKAELVSSLQNGGDFTDIEALVAAGLLPEDIKTSESTGYNFAIKVADGKKRYYATATPAAYGKSGKLSFQLEPDAKGISHVKSADNGGQQLKNK
jgi:hypothetical protein